jgi:hypothetical protein
MKFNIHPGGEGTVVDPAAKEAEEAKKARAKENRKRKKEERAANAGTCTHHKENCIR